MTFIDVGKVCRLLDGERPRFHAADLSDAGSASKTVADVRGQYEKMRDEHGFRLLDYTVDFDGATPRACFRLRFAARKSKRSIPIQGLDLISARF